MPGVNVVVKVVRQPHKLAYLKIIKMLNAWLKKKCKAEKSSNLARSSRDVLSWLFVFAVAMGPFWGLVQWCWKTGKALALDPVRCCVLLCCFLT